MRFLKTLLWVMVIVAIGIFSIHNWTPITVNLWGGLELDTKLPVLLIVTFLLGMLPTFILHRTTRWSLRRKLTTAERALADKAAPLPALVAEPEISPLQAPPQMQQVPQ